MIKTWVLVIVIGNSSPAVTVPDYGSAAECELARKMVERWKSNSSALCIPGPVRPN
jgi:hypothetical protein